MSQRPFKELVEAIGGEGGCDPQNAIIDVTLLGNPTPGTFGLRWEINNVAEWLEFGTDDDAATAKAIMLTHSKIGEDGGDDIIVTGGVWPNATMRFEFTGRLKNKDISIPIAQWSYQSGWVGVGVICACAQKGHS